MADNIMTKLLSTVAGDDTYVQSYSDYIQSAKNKYLTLVNQVSEIIADPSTTIDVDKTILIANDDGVTLSSLKEALTNELDMITTLNGNTVSIDSCLDYINQTCSLSDSMTSALDYVRNGTNESASIANLYLTENFSKFSESAGDVKDTISEYAKVIANSSMTTRDKIEKIRVMFEGDKSGDYSTDTEMFNDVNNSIVTQTTGISPFTSIGLSIKRGFESIDWSSVKSAIRTGCNAIANGTKKAASWIASKFPKAIANLATNTLELTGMTNCDIANIEKGDGTIDNACLYVDIDDDSLGNINTYLYQKLSVVSFPIGTNLSMGMTDMIADWKHDITKDIWYKYDIPGARIYICRDSNGVNHLRVKWKLIDINVIKDDFSNDITLAEFFTAISSRSAAFEPAIENQFFLFDDYIFNCLKYSKAVAALYLSHEIKGELNDAVTSHYNSFASLQLSLALLTTDNGSGINSTFSHNQITVGGVTYDDPTNSDFADACSRFDNLSLSSNGEYSFLDEGSTFGSYYSNAENGGSGATLMSMILGHCVHQWEIANNGEWFTPYIKTPEISTGSYYIRSDSDNVNKVLLRGAIALGAIAITVGLVYGIKLKKDLKIKAVTSNLQAGNLQSAIQAKFLAGETVSKEELNSMYKATKKAVRLNKLTGGFASITTGLSTWGSEALNTPSLFSGNQELKTLITG